MSSERGHYTFDSNEYARPNDDWVCGGACDGLPCSRGPSPSGECGAPCEPFKIDDRWYCSNAANLTGCCDDGPRADGACAHDPPECSPIKLGGRYVCNRGACPDGPFPDGSCSRRLQVCRPVRTVQAQRRFVTATVFGLAVGLGLLVLGGPGRQTAVSPGNVSSVHSAIADNCAACHHAADDNAFALVDAAVGGPRPTAQNDLCLKCHQSFAEFDTAPHTMSPLLLEVSGQATRNGQLAVEATHVVFEVSPELACSSCHHEHRGTMHDLTELPDQQCQICHSSTFHTFAKDHPPFTDYPLARRSEIHFNHSTHYGIHFSNFARTVPGGTAPGTAAEIAMASSETCYECHVVDKSGAYMVTLGYEKMCASCHDAQIWDDQVPPMPVLALRFPADNGAPLPYAPGIVAGPFDLPPFMQLLLASDQRFQALYPGFQQMDWRDAASIEGAESPDTEQLTGAITDLLSELRRDPYATICRRLEAAGGGHLSQSQIERLARTTATADFNKAVDHMAEALSTTDVALVDARWESSPWSPADAETDGMAVAGWSYDELSGLLTYRPREHADSLMQQWTDAAVAIVTPQQYLDPDDGSDAGIAALADYLTHPMSAGRCAKCHTFDEENDRLVVNWHAANQSGGIDEITFFRHAPHIVFLPGQDRCVTCHKLEVDSEFHRAEYFLDGLRVSIDSSHGASAGFPQMFRAAVCAKCHHSEGASQRCTTCHNYHARSGASDAVSEHQL